jgi:hypothetical protein
LRQRIHERVVLMLRVDPQHETSVAYFLRQLVATGLIERQFRQITGGPGASTGTGGLR